jgi:phosphoribosylformylglycinamidine synthase
MQTFLGGSALSSFRRQKLLTNLQAILPHLKTVYTHYMYFVAATDELTADAQNLLLKVLPQARVAPKDLQFEALVVPRLGTLSPWASKAQDIVSHCGVSGIRVVERGMAYQFSPALDKADIEAISDLLYDKMTESLLLTQPLPDLFTDYSPAALMSINLLEDGLYALQTYNKKQGLALSDEEVDYLYQRFIELGRNPSDVELMMFAQANSEHCRHKIFNASWRVDGEPQAKSLFKMIKNTYEHHSDGVLSAYSDNAAVIAGSKVERFYPAAQSAQYGFMLQHADIMIKVETHNHPTAISPFAGAATGSGGEIRDEGATGRGGKPKAGLCGFSVSNLNIPGLQQPWEHAYGKPERIVSALDIMLQGPIGAAAFNNEFGRPNICGYFRTFEQNIDGQVYGYHKPIMLAGGYGNISREHVLKQQIPAGAQLIVLGGPAMLIGMGGGAASSVASGSSDASLDFASVQRGNPEMERRCQEVIDRCWAMEQNNPIISIHDVGAGGLSNALPELIHDAERGGKFELRKIINAEPGLSPVEIWCNEAQERYVLAIDGADVAQFSALAERERCPFAVVGEATATQHLRLNDAHFSDAPIDIPMDLLFGNAPKMQRDVTSSQIATDKIVSESLDLAEAVQRVLHLPSVADKSFLINIGDRSVGGLIARDQCVGPWQIPVSDVAVTAAGFNTYYGEAMAMGERAPLAIIDSVAAAKMAVAETITNIAAAHIEKLSDVKLSANWMAAAGSEGQDAKLYAAVKAVGEEMCPQLDLTIPVGKDSMSMRTQWDNKSVMSPISLIVTGFAPVVDIRKTATPALKTDQGETCLLLLDLAAGKQRLGFSALAQVFNLTGDSVPNVENISLLKTFFDAIQNLHQDDLLLAYHDRSDGGLLACVSEMMFAGHVGVDVQIGEEAIAELFNEELGAVIQVRCKDVDKVKAILANVPHANIGQLNDADALRIHQNETCIYQQARTTLQQMWSATSYHVQKLRDNPVCAEQEYENIILPNTGLFVKPGATILAPMISSGQKPKVAVLREQGVNGQVEMAAAFDRAGFIAVDIHMSDLLAGRVKLNDFEVLAACGGFSYGDVLGAGSGWAKTILFNPQLRDQFAEFFARENTLSLGVCNGCQMLSQLKSLIPGAAQWPEFVRNTSEQFEARFVMVEVMKSPSLMLTNLQGWQLPIVVAHGEGRVSGDINQSDVAMRYIDHQGLATERYPFNPNGSAEGITALTTADGRATIMMPHPERVFRNAQWSWTPEADGEDSSWLQLFAGAREALN